MIEIGGVPFALTRPGDGPVVAVALHAGHILRPDLAEHIALSEPDRLREEDPATAEMVPERLALLEAARSRFEVDLNRPRFRAVYQGPQDAWGLRLYKHELPDDADRVSRAGYDTFYAHAFDWLSRVAEQHGRFVVLDIHSYNHRRDGATGTPAAQAENPEVNLGTGRMELPLFAPVAEAFRDSMVAQGFDCRADVKFRGGHFAHWVTETFPGVGTALAIEFKKTYMDEWSGEVDAAQVARIREALDHAAAVVEEALVAVG